MRRAWLLLAAATLLTAPATASAKAWSSCKTVPGRTLASNPVWRIVSTPLTSTVGDPTRSGYLIACRPHDPRHRRMRVIGKTFADPNQSGETFRQLVGDRVLVRTHANSAAATVSWDVLIDLAKGTSVRIGVAGASTDAIVLFQSFLRPDGALATLTRGLARAEGAVSAAASGPIPPAAVNVWDATGRHVGPLVTSIGPEAAGATPGFSYITPDGTQGVMPASGTATGLPFKHDDQIRYLATTALDCRRC